MWWLGTRVVSGHQSLSESIGGDAKFKLRSQVAADTVVPESDHACIAAEETYHQLFLEAQDQHRIAKVKSSKAKSVKRHTDKLVQRVICRS